MNTKIDCYSRLLQIIAVIALLTGAVIAQATEFTYQGNLKNGGSAATGNYDFEFVLFDALSGGSQVGTPLTRTPVAVVDGNFTVKLDFGSQFPGANRFLEIRVRQSGGGGFTPLSPRQQIDSSPYSIKSLSAETATTATTAATATNALQLGGVAANQFVVTGDVRLSDARTPTAGSTNYVQNTTNPQAASNFNISGNGTAAGTLSGGVVNAATQYNIGGNRVLSVVAVQGNLFAGFDAGTANTTGSLNSFVGGSAGFSNTTGSLNSFVGSSAGDSNTTGNNNSFFGRSSGASNTTGIDNSFVGVSAGFLNASGAKNSFVGVNAGDTNTVGSNNSLLGNGADVGSNNLTYAGAFGSNARVDQSNSIVLGAINGVNTATADTNVGIGTTAPSNRLHIVANGGNIILGNPGCDSGFAAIGFSSTLSGCSNYAIFGNATQTVISRPTGGVIYFREGNSTQASIGPGGTFTANGAGITNLNASSLGSGTVADARLSANVALLTGAQTFSGAKTFSAGTFFNGNVGIGTTSPTASLHIAVNSGQILMGDSGCDPGFVGIGFATTLSNCNNYSLKGNGSDTILSRPAGGTLYFREGNNTQMTIAPGGVVNANGAGITNLNASNISTGMLNNARLGVVPIANGGTGSATKNFVDLTTTQTVGGNKTFSSNVAIGTPSTRANLTLEGRLYIDAFAYSDGENFPLCAQLTSSVPLYYQVVRNCGLSSIRYKTGVSDYTSGLSSLNRLRPVNFRWKESGRADFGLIAEEVAEVEPLLATYDSTGQVKGVKYDRVGMVLINAVKEQQAQIEALEKQIEQQRAEIEQLKRKTAEIDELKAIICGQKPDAQLCRLRD